MNEGEFWHNWERTHADMVQSLDELAIEDTNRHARQGTSFTATLVCHSLMDMAILSNPEQDGTRYARLGRSLVEQAIANPAMPGAEREQLRLGEGFGHFIRAQAYYYQHDFEWYTERHMPIGPLRAAADYYERSCCAGRARLLRRPGMVDALVRVLILTGRPAEAARWSSKSKHQRACDIMPFGQWLSRVAQYLSADVEHGERRAEIINAARGVLDMFQRGDVSAVQRSGWTLDAAIDLSLIAAMHFGELAVPATRSAVVRRLRYES